MSLLAYAPNAFSIYLSLTGGAAGGYIERTIKRWIAAGEDDGQGNITLSPLKGHETIIANVARDWATRYGFVSASLGAIISVLVICSKPVRYDAAAVGIILLLIIFSVMLWNVFKLDPDELVTLTDWWFGWTPATWCKIILVLVNVVLMFEIAGKQGDLAVPRWFPVLH